MKTSIVTTRYAIVEHQGDEYRVYIGGCVALWDRFNDEWNEYALIDDLDEIRAAGIEALNEDLAR